MLVGIVVVVFALKKVLLPAQIVLFVGCDENVGRPVVSPITKSPNPVIPETLVVVIVDVPEAVVEDQTLFSYLLTT